MTTLKRMLVVSTHGDQIEVTRMSDQYPSYVIGTVEARLVGYGIDMTRRYMTPSDAPRVGDYIDVDIDDQEAA